MQEFWEQQKIPFQLYFKHGRYEDERIVAEVHNNSFLDEDKLTLPSTEHVRYLVDSLKKSICAWKVGYYNRNILSDTLILNIILQK